VFKSFQTNRKSTKQTVPAGHGCAFAIAKGTQFRIVDVHGEPVVDFIA
jgi:uncharacterized protein YcgI (DUF1989 family)